MFAKLMLYLYNSELFYLMLTIFEHFPTGATGYCFKYMALTLSLENK